jgi:beta-1,4-N-acetylglucosaminyltransferase
MIFGTVGTERFDELVRALDELAPELKESVVVQIGKGAYEPKMCKFFRFIPNIEKYYNKANLIITHGGAGTIFKLLGKGLKLIGVSNPEKPGEHQKDILQALSQQGYILWCRDLKELKYMIQKAKHLKIRKYKSPKCRIAAVIEQKIIEWFE